MKQIILSLIVLTIFAFGCEKPTKPIITDQKLVAMNTQIYYLDNWFTREELISIFNTRIQILADKGVNCITFYKGGYIFDNHIYEEIAGTNLNGDGVAGWGNLTNEQLINLSNLAHGAGMKVQLALDLFPITQNPNGWCVYNGQRVNEGTKHTFIPSNTGVFFDEYAQYAKSCAELATAMHADLFNFGQELQMVSGAQYSQYWEQIINEIELVYSGPIVYYSNNGHYGAPDDEFESMCSILKTGVDYLGCTMYIQGISNLNNPSLDLIRQGVVSSFQKWEQRGTTYNKKVIIGETGCGSYDSALGDGYTGNMYNQTYLAGVQMNQEIQANYYQACLENLKNKNSIFGLCWDKAYYQRWSPTVNEKGPSPFSDENTPKQMLNRIKNHVQ